MEFLKAWVLQPTYLPAWLQAVAAITAICISVIALRRTGAAERQRTELQKTGMAVAIYPEIRMLKVTVQSVRKTLTGFKDQFSGIVGQSIANNVLGTGTIAVPPMLDRHTDRLFLLGKVAGPSCLSLVRAILIYNEVVEALAARIATLNYEGWVGTLAQIEKQLNLLDAIIDKCEAEVRPLHDAVQG